MDEQLQKLRRQALTGGVDEKQRYLQYRKRSGYIFAVMYGAYHRSWEGSFQEKIEPGTWFNWTRKWPNGPWRATGPGNLQYHNGKRGEILLPKNG